jgi:hypothetical protein
MLEHFHRLSPFYLFQDFKISTTITNPNPVKQPADGQNILQPLKEIGIIPHLVTLVVKIQTLVEDKPCIQETYGFA